MTAAAITILDVGHGSCAVLTYDEMTSLIDTGSGGTILEYLNATGRSSVDRVFISHADRDHCGGLVGLFSSKAFPVNEVWLNADAFKGTQMWTALSYEMDALTEAGLLSARVGVRRGDSVQIGPILAEVLAPRMRLVSLGAGGRDALNRRIESNTMSLVIRLIVNAQPIALFAGDIDEVGLDHLLDHGGASEMSAPVLIFPHHGGNVGRGGQQANRAFATRICEAVQPQVIVFSHGRSQHSNPRPEIVSAVRAVVPSARIICTQLSTNCAANSPLPKAGPRYLPMFGVRGRVLGHCCAGSVTINVVEDGWNVSPEVDLHLTFLESNAPTAMCRTGAAEA